MKLPKKITVEFDVHEYEVYMQWLKVSHYIIKKIESRMDRDFREGKKHYYKEG